MRSHPLQLTRKLSGSDNWEREREKEREREREREREKKIKVEGAIAI